MSRQVVPLLLAIASSLGAAAAGSTGGPLVGSWRLVSYTDTPVDEAPTQAFGKEPVGLFVFTEDGHVSINIMRNPPDVSAPTTDPDPEACVPGWFCAYFGTYDVDYRAGTWVTHVRGGNIPAYLGTDQKRRFSIHGDRLVISESYQVAGKTVRAERVLLRDKGR